MSEHVDEFELRKRGGDWLGAARKWLQHRRTTKGVHGDQITWGDENARFDISAAHVEELAAVVAAAAMNEQTRRAATITDITVSELAGLRNELAHLKQIWGDACEHVAEACEMLGGEREKEPLDTWKLRELATRAVRERDGAQEQAAYWQRTANEFEQESIRDLAQRDRRIAELEAALERARQSCPQWCPHREHIDAAISTHEQPKVDPLSDARFAFDVYRAQMQRGGGFSGLPTWESLKPEVREEWRQAAFKAQRNVTDAPAGRIADLESAASLLVAKLGHRDGREFMARDASLEAHWKELRQLLVACAPAPADTTEESK